MHKVLFAALSVCTMVVCWGSVSVQAAYMFDEQWGDQFGSSLTDTPGGVVVSSDGTSYIAGTTSGLITTGVTTAPRDAFVARYDSAGNQTWITQFGAADASGGALDDAYGVVLSGSSLVVGGSTDQAMAGQTNTGGRDAFLTWVDLSSGNISSHAQYGSQSGGDEDAYALTADSSGNLYQGGRTSGAFTGHTNAGGWDAYLTKYNTSSSSRDWTLQLGSSAYDTINAVTADPSGSLYAIGTTYGAIDFAGDAYTNTNAGSSDAFVAKLNSDGTEVWARQIGGAGMDFGYGVATDSAGNLYLAGDTYGSMYGENAGSRDLWLAKYDPDGTELWGVQIGSVDPDVFGGLATTPQGNVVLVGGMNSNIYFLMLNGMGSDLMDHDFGTADADTVEAITVGPDGTIYITGATAGDLYSANAGDGNDVFLLATQTPEPMTGACLLLGGVLLQMRRRTERPAQR